MQVILTEEEYNALKMQAGAVNAPDHITLQNCAMKTIENFERFCETATADSHFYWNNLNPGDSLKMLLKLYKEEMQSHFVR